ncbi:hypothetical protein GWI33_012658 [Rhynchophorus ferrugineus]|uniref:Brinker DNA-binding domain-containing protein n=1 Tax=Rhynchophorus ferrugineus TaxID=354439 RepID=A0A834IIC0_RHYFE|nr:hypothetical protein GWI33_012658 [Rhynchophorus ferrugineus]
MAHGLNSVIRRGVGAVQCKPEGKTGVGSRRIFSPQFKLQVLDSYRNDADCKGNQRATARKYGIHRRQIQKWLQVENTLRSGVGGKQPPIAKSEVSLSGHRQRDDESSGELRSASLAGESRVPALETPAGWRSHQSPVPLPEPPVVPMDLSLKRPAVSPAPLQRLSPSQCDVWDLSTKRKAEEDGASKPVKLFKPYLDDLRDSDVESPPVPVKMSPPSPPTLYCCAPPVTCSPELYYINNNNNNLYDAKSPEYNPAYTLHELQPNTSFYPYPYYHPELSPTYCSYDDPNLKYHQSYSVDFKFSTITDCCTFSKASQVRLPQSKYPVQNKQWIKVDTELNCSSETLKHIHAVR